MKQYLIDIRNELVKIENESQFLNFEKDRMGRHDEHEGNINKKLQVAKIKLAHVLKVLKETYSEL